MRMLVQIWSNIFTFEYLDLGIATKLCNCYVYRTIYETADSLELTVFKWITVFLCIVLVCRMECAT